MTGILQSSLFSPGLPASLNYGALGSSLGHEVTHGFDAQGHLFDEHGNKQSRWLQHENQHFKERAQCFIDQYGHFRVSAVLRRPVWALQGKRSAL